MALVVLVKLMCFVLVWFTISYELLFLQRAYMGSACGPILVIIFQTKAYKVNIELLVLGFGAISGCWVLV